LTPIIQAKPSQHWLEGLEARSVSCGPINTIKQVFDDPQVLARDMKISMPHAATGGANIDIVGSPIKMSETGVTYRHAPPTLGQHTDEVLQEVLDLTPDDIAKQKANGTI
ncbi:MAG: CoA transferase, partial [Rhodospirillales bacterium]